MLLYILFYAPYKEQLEDRQMGLGLEGTIVNGRKYSAEESYKFLDKGLWDWMVKHDNPIEKGNIWVR